MKAALNLNKQTFDIVVACDCQRGISKNGILPWHLPGDMKYFQELTSKRTTADQDNLVIMGRRTWESIPLASRPLKNRINIVLSRQKELVVPAGVIIARSIEEALSIRQSKTARQFIIGGSQIYAEAISHPFCRDLYLTQILTAFDCDLFFPQYEERFNLISSSNPQADNDVKYIFQHYRNKDD